MGDGRCDPKLSSASDSPAPFSPLTSPISLLSYHHLPCVECSASPSLAFHRARDALDSAPPPSVHSARICPLLQHFDDARGHAGPHIADRPRVEPGCRRLRGAPP